MRPLFVVCTLLISSLAFAQQMSEDDISMDMIAKHYYYYPNSESESWTKVVKGGEERFNVAFTYDGKTYSVTYNAKSWRLTERIMLSAKDLPAVTLDYINRRFADDKFKVVEFTQLNTFENLRPTDSFYSMEVKVKKDLYVLYFDEKLEHLDGSSTQVLSGL